MQNPGPASDLNDGASYTGAAIVLVLLIGLVLSIWPGWSVFWPWVAENLLAVNLLIPALVVVAGWLVGHRLTFERELAARRRDARIKVLEATFIAFQQLVGRTRTPEHSRALEQAIAQMQLYGTKEQLDMLDGLIVGLLNPEGGIVNLAPLLVELQNSIRGELGVPPVGNPAVAWLVLYDEDSPNPQMAGSPPPPRRLLHSDRRQRVKS